MSRAAVAISQSIRRNLLRCATVTAVCAAIIVTTPLRADDIVSETGRWSNLEILSIEAGKLICSRSGGSSTAVALRDITWMKIDTVSGMKEFNEAEEHLRRGEPDAALAEYDRALKVVRPQWISLIRARALSAADRAGRFDRTIREFLEIRKSDPVTAAALIPGSIPDRRSRQIDRAETQLEREVSESSGQAAMTAQLMLFAMLDRLEPEKSLPAARELIGLADEELLAIPRVVEIRLQAIRRVLTAGEVKPALAELDRMIATSPGPELPAVLLLKAQALEKNANSPADYLDAAAAAMRVAIHFADSLQAGEALLLAADAHEHAGHVPAARRLLQETLSRTTIAKATRETARTALERLNRTYGEGRKGADNKPSASAAQDVEENVEVSSK